MRYEKSSSFFSPNISPTSSMCAFYVCDRSNMKEEQKKRIFEIYDPRENDDLK